MSNALYPLTWLARATTDDAASTIESFSEEIKCYNLPYGVLGFVSHILTYYTIVCLWCGRKPFWPFSGVSFSRFDLALGAFALLISTLLSIVTIVRCKDTWQLLVIAVWKMSMSLLNGLTAIHVAVLFILKKLREKRQAKKQMQREASESGANNGDEKGNGTATEEGNVAPISVVIDPLKWVSWWIALYIPGMFAGIVGLMALVVKAQDHAGIRKLTAGFYTVVGAGTLIVILGMVYRLRSQGDLGGPEKAKRIIAGGLVWLVGSFSVLAVFYSDWALGMMTGNLTGLPSADNSALYWTYWFAKRLPMFSL